MKSADDFDFYGSDYRSLERITISEVVQNWADGKGELVSDFYLIERAPETVWSAVLEILRRDPTPDQIALLAAGPVEYLLAKHGTTFIDRLETVARENPRFNYLLGGVWEYEISPEIWNRVQKARKEVW